MGASSTFYDRCSLLGEAVIFSQGVWNQFCWSSARRGGGAEACGDRGCDRRASWCSSTCGEGTDTELAACADSPGHCRNTHSSRRAVTMQCCRVISHWPSVLSGGDRGAVSQACLPLGRLLMSLLFFFHLCCQIWYSSYSLLPQQIS